MKKSIVALSVLLNCGSLVAGTMGTMAAEPSFGGLYVGLGTGVLSYMLDAKSTIVNVTPAHARIQDSLTNVFFTGQLGYGWMFKEQTYFGVKGKYSIHQLVTQVQ